MTNRVRGRTDGGAFGGRAASRLAACVVAATFVPCCPLLAQLNPNPGFEDGSASDPTLPSDWALAGTVAAAELDSLDARSGRFSLRMESGRPDEVAAVGRTVTADGLRHTRVQLSGYIRTRGVGHGYAGLLLRFDRDGGAIFTDAMAGRGATGTTEWTRFETSALVPEGAEEVTFGGILVGSGAAWFDDLTLNTEVPVDFPDSRLAARPDPVAGSLAAPDPGDPSETGPVAYLAHVLDILEERSLVADSVDWTSVRVEHLAAVEEAGTTRAAYDRIDDALRALGDGHSRFLPPDAAAGRATPGAPGTGPTSPVSSARLDGGLAYLRVPGFRGTSQTAADAFASHLNDRIARLDRGDVCGWIVDLRANPGGNMWPMLAGLAPLIGEGRIGSFLGRDGAVVPWTLRDGAVMDGVRVAARVDEPYGLADAGPAVAVLTGPGTASSGEAVAVAFRGRPRTRSFGEPTRGLSTANTSIALSDGATLELTTAVFVDRTGVGYGGPLIPDEAVPLARERVPSSEDTVVLRAADWIRTTSACR